jgi:hypothetical protein
MAGSIEPALFLFPDETVKVVDESRLIYDEEKKRMGFLRAGVPNVG